MIPNDRQIHIQLFISRPDGTTWENVSDYVSFIEVELGDVSRIGTGLSGVDGVARQLTFRLIDDSNNFSPTDQTSPWNQFDGEYAPLLYPYREVQLKAAVTAPGGTPSTWTTLFHGYLGDEISVEGRTATCLCRDLSKRLQDCYIEETRQYGSAEGVALETVLQQILDDNLGTSEVILYCPVSPGYMVLKTDRSKVEYKSVWDALQDMVAQIGWFLGYRWDPNTSQFRLTLMEPPRTKTTPDVVLTAEDDIYVQELGTSDTDVRNAILVSCRDESTGKKITVTVEDAASIAKFGRRAMQIEEGDTSLITSQSEAEAMANVALSDLKDLSSTTRIDMPFLPELDVFAGIEIQNPRLSSTNDFFGVESVRHTIDFNGGAIRTAVIASGRIIGGRQRWLRMDTRPGSPGEPPYSETQLPPDTPVWDTCEFIRDVTLRWHPVARAIEYEIRRIDADWGTALGRVWHGTETTAVIAPQSRSETFYLRARDAGGRYSQISAVKTVTNATPSTPSQPTVQEFFSALWITINPVADNDIVSYNLYMTPVDDGGDPTGDTQVTTYLSAGRITYNASPGTRFRVEVAAADVLGEGSKSAPVYAETTDLDEITVPDWVREPIENISDKWIVDTDEDGNLIGLVRVEDGEQHSHIAVLADVFSIATPEGRRQIFVFDTADKKLYLMGDLIAEGLIRATEIQAELAKHLLLQAQLATIDEADVLWLRADKITVGGSAPGISLMKPEGARLWHFDGSLMSTDGTAPESGAVATLRPDGRFGGCVAVEVGTTNLCPSSVWEQGGLAGATGNPVSATNRIRTQLISASPSTQYTVSVQNYEVYRAAVVHEYRSDETWIQRTIYTPVDGVYTFTTHSDTGFVKLLALRNDDADLTPDDFHDMQPQLEQRSYPTSFVNGTRAAGKLEYKVTYGERGTLSWWMTGSSEAAYVTYVFDLNRSGSDINRIYQAPAPYAPDPEDQGVVWRCGSTYLRCVLPIDPGDWLDCSATWNKTTKCRTLTVYNHTQGVNNSVSADDADQLVFDDVLTYCGSTNRLADVRYDEVMYDPLHAATPEQIAAWYAMGAPFVDPDSAINADASPISAARGQVYIGEPGIAVANGAMIFVSGTFSHDQLGRLITAAVDRPLTTDPGGQKSVSAPVEISAARGAEIYKGKLNVWAGTGGAGDTRYIHDGRVTDDGIIGMDALKLTGTVAMENLPAHLLRTAPGVSGAVMYYARTPIVELGPKATMQLTFTTAMPYVPELLVIDRRGFLSDTLEFDNVSKTGFRITNTHENYWIRSYDNVSFFWIALCASHDPSTSSCDNCQEECQGDCQQYGCQDSCQTGVCQLTCQSDCQTACEGACQDTCMFSCQLPPPLTLWE